MGQAEATAELQQAARAWQAEEFASNQRAAERLESFEQATATPAPPPTPEQQQAEQLAAVAEAALPKICAMVWRVLDRVIVSQLGPQCAATQEELAELGRLTVPVVTKYLPAGLEGVFATPEGVLIAAAGITYGAKLMLPADANSPRAAEVAAQ